MWFLAPDPWKYNQNHCKCQISDLMLPELWKLNRQFISLHNCNYESNDLKPPEPWKLNSPFLFTIVIAKSAICGLHSSGRSTVHFFSQLQLWKQQFEASRFRVVVTKSAIWDLQSSGGSTVIFSLRLQSWKQRFEAPRALEAQQPISIQSCS